MGLGISSPLGTRGKQEAFLGVAKLKSSKPKQHPLKNKRAILAICPQAVNNLRLVLQSFDYTQQGGDTLSTKQAKRSISSG